MPMGSEQPTFVTSLIQVAQKSQDLPRGPYGLKEALRKAKTADAGCLERILVDASEPAWRAYYIATRDASSSHGFRGQAQLSRHLEEFSAQSIEQQRILADQLAAELSKQSTPQMENVVVQSGENIATINTGNGAKRRRTAGDRESCTTGIPDRYVETVSSITMTNGTQPHHVSQGSLSVERDGEIIDLMQGNVYVKASLRAAKELFEAEFYDSIQRVRVAGEGDSETLVADISLYFQQGPTRGHFGCQMEVAIAEEKVVGYAQEFFNMKLEQKGGLRFIQYPNGGRIVPDPSVKLRQFRCDKLGRIFKSKEGRQAATASPVYKRDEKEGRDCTDGVTMTISNRPTDGATITIFLGEFRAARLKAQLYDE